MSTRLEWPPRSWLRLAQQTRQCQRQTQPVTRTTPSTPPVPPWPFGRRCYCQLGQHLVGQLKPATNPHGTQPAAQHLDHIPSSSTVDGSPFPKSATTTQAGSSVWCHTAIPKPNGTICSATSYYDMSFNDPFVYRHFAFCTAHENSVVCIHERTKQYLSTPHRLAARDAVPVDRVTSMQAPEHHEPPKDHILPPPMAMYGTDMSNHDNKAMAMPRQNSTRLNPIEL
ncbi:hypothetical protein H257_15198 [Aphanomyces astaci]|uniref:Uncharacterized protein n=1 Tax=Aphanomyces astaci TaxID=112090 RepID=W4FQZ8_APHAT|nr:hypothetical protein H257_15198 [Aphanomyces astaci]ETV69058.1 hypothetical protein H257_15198 [Aphanomyces astaci]|eukprot:XP_009841517.1 hypothetical protein H257_15198 [Aphanomyces astaci]